MFPLPITAIDKVIFRDEVESVTCPGSEGELTVLKDHVSLVTPLKEGEITVRKGDDTHTFPISTGFLVVQKHETTILV